MESRRAEWGLGATHRVEADFIDDKQGDVHVLAPSQAAHRDYWRAVPREPDWLLVEWPMGERQPTKYWLSNR